MKLKEIGTSVTNKTEATLFCEWVNDVSSKKEGKGRHMGWLTDF